ncbi:hypothetical protein NM208_g6891 [Fusarium decemcellulare]|uniref:Uncharacterized protein n=1 Tax=Fusarium decemcellulare TaxID=57161 RepID=A0ACC1SB77_9HYPO|nr:hypothetical protein NM208_g6891 [Fusarium decemcellulare]
MWDSKHDGLPLETSAAIFRKADTKSGPFNAWLELVHQYSQYQMSNDGDKLVALAGLVEVLQDRIANSNERHYHCGVFQSDIERSLMWYGTKDGRHLARAPSWSWASSGGKVSFNILKVTEGARCWIVVKSLRHQDYLDPSVIQPTCRLTIRGPVVHMNCVMGVEKSKGLPHTPPHIACDIATLNIVLDDGCFNIGWAIEDETGIITGSPHPSRTGKVQIAFLVVWGEGEEVIPFRAWGILMRPLGEQAGVYRRIGLAFVRDVEAIWEAVESPEDFDLI